MLVDSQNKAKELMHKYVSDIPKSWYNKLEDVLLGLQNNLTIPDDEIKLWHMKRFASQETDKLLTQTSERNNKGIAAENVSDIESAISYYEENVKVGYPATQSFDRLMVIYRKRKSYQDELRVIDKAIEVFTKENEKRFLKAIQNVQNKPYLNQLQLALEQNKGVKNNEGWYIFSPYPTLKWIERRDKVLNLIKRHITPKL